jgi:hypothetical protein
VGAPGVGTDGLLVAATAVGWLCPSVVLDAVCYIAKHYGGLGTPRLSSIQSPDTDELMSSRKLGMFLRCVSGRLGSVGYGGRTVFELSAGVGVGEKAPGRVPHRTAQKQWRERNMSGYTSHRLRDWSYFRA